MDNELPEDLNLKHVKYVYRVTPHDENVLTHQLVGKVLAHGQNLDVLSNYMGHLPLPSGPMDDRTKRVWEGLLRSPYFDVVSAQDLHDGHRADLLPTVEPASAPEDEDPNGGEPIPDPEAVQRPASVFEYRHPLLTQPATIEVRSKVMHFNGQPLSPPEMGRIMDNIKSGRARIRYKRDQKQEDVRKMESLFEDLVKIEPHLENALGQLRGAVKAGHVDPDVLKALTREIFVDPMVPGMGNKKAYADFLSRPRQGVHIRMDGNDFGSINKIHSFEHGNHAISAMGQAMREAMDETVGAKNGKLYRIGGDEFHGHVPTQEHASLFARKLREKLDAIPAVGGTHRLSVSMGFSPDAEGADQASIKAKQAKKAMNYPMGQAKTHAYSAVPGNEGHVPLETEKLPVPNLEVPAPAQEEKPVAAGPMPKTPTPAGTASGPAPVPALKPKI